MSGRPLRKNRRVAGFTLVELLVVIAIVGILLAMLIPAVQSIRETARRSNCKTKITNLGTAVQNYASIHRRFPPGSHNGFSIFVHLLPYVEKDAIYDDADLTRPEDTPPNDRLSEIPVPCLWCPSDGGAQRLRPRGDQSYGTNYVGNAGPGYLAFGYNGIFGTRGDAVEIRAVTDGLSNTSLISECLVGDGSREFKRQVFRGPRLEYEDFAKVCREIEQYDVNSNSWTRGRIWSNGSDFYALYNHLTEPNFATCKWGTSWLDGSYPASSNHPGGVNVVFADGHTRFIHDTIDIDVWRAMGSRSSLQ